METPGADHNPTCVDGILVLDSGFYECDSARGGDDST